jgi:hypothetical protein
MRTTRLLAGTAAAATLLATAAVPAQANDGDVIRRGSCSETADWKLKVGPEDGRLEVEGEVDSNRVGQRWRWQIRHNGNVSARGRAVTTARSGSFDVERRVVNAPGVDRIAWRAVNRATGQTCRGGLRF